MGSLVGLLADVIVYWALPIVGAALFSSVAAVIIAINPFLGSLTILTAASLTVIYSLKQRAIGQAALWAVLLVPYGILAIISPQWAILWGLGVSLLALGVLFVIPGVVLPRVRTLITTVVLALIGLHAVLSFTVWSHGMIFLTILGLLAMATGSWLFSRGARPWEIRRSQRQAGRLAVLVGLTLTTVGILVPLMSIPTIHVTIPRPIVSMWETITNHTEAWLTASRRVLIGERAKTNALLDLEPELKQAHRERWEQVIQRIPAAPLTPREWRELGLEQDP